jgi:hypothetical protein
MPQGQQQPRVNENLIAIIRPAPVTPRENYMWLILDNILETIGNFIARPGEKPSDN